MGLTGLALLLHKVNAMNRQVSYHILQNKSENVDYFQKDAAQYEILRKGFNKRINKYPKIIALCKNTLGVVEAVQYAKANNLLVTVKSGGHSMEGFSCLDGGMVINLSLLNSMQWIDANTIRVGVACTLKQIYEKLIPAGKYLPGGSCQSVGIGGLTLGGGYGLMSRNYGLTCDSLLEATGVTAAGQIINTKEDPELLWALKGGGNGNMAIVTEMTFSVQKPGCGHQHSN